MFRKLGSHRPGLEKTGVQTIPGLLSSIPGTTLSTSQPRNFTEVGDDPWNIYKVQLWIFKVKTKLFHT